MRISDWSSDVCSSDLIHPGALAQYPHRDQDMWQGPKGEVEYLLNVIWPLSPFTAENGATRLWPHSHRPDADRSEEHTSELQSLMRISYAVFCLTKTKQTNNRQKQHTCNHNRTE